MTTPNPQPTQMEQRMERSKDADVAWLMRWFGNGECCTQHTREHLGSIVARLTRPTPDLGDDGELVERLRAYRGGTTEWRALMDQAAKMVEALVAELREDREYFDQRADADLDVSGYTGNEEMRRLVAIDAALAHARQEGDK